MADLSLRVTINGEQYSARQLARYEYERALHGLHEMLHLGASLEKDGRRLSRSELNWLPPAETLLLSYETRNRLGAEGILALFKDTLAASDMRWKAYNSAPIEEQGVWLGHTSFEVDGLSLTDRDAYSVFNSDNRGALLSVMPEHYNIVGSISSGGQRIMETIGLLGEPVDTYGVASQDIPAYIPLRRDSEFPVVLVAELHLQSDDTPIRTGAIHQFKPTDSGFLLKSTFFCPRHAPQAVAEGHPVHFAIEMTNDFRQAFQQSKRRS